MLVSYCLVGQLESYRKLFSASIWNMLSPPPCRKGARAPFTSHAGMLPNWRSRFYPPAGSLVIPSMTHRAQGRVGIVGNVGICLG